MGASNLLLAVIENQMENQKWTWTMSIFGICRGRGFSNYEAPIAVLLSQFEGTSRSYALLFKYSHMQA